MSEQVPDGPTTTIVHFVFQPDVDYLDPSTDAGVEWEEALRAISREQGWAFTHWGPHLEEPQRATVLICWTNGVPSSNFTPDPISTSADSAPKPISALSSLLASPFRIENVSLFPTIYMFLGPSEMFTFYIPASVPQTELEPISERMEAFLSMTCSRLGGDSPGDLTSSTNGWVTHNVVHGGKSMKAYVLLLHWKSREAELRYKDSTAMSELPAGKRGISDLYESWFLHPVEEMAALGVECESDHVEFRLWSKDESQRRLRKANCILQ